MFFSHLSLASQARDNKKNIQKQWLLLRIGAKKERALQVIYFLKSFRKN